MTGTDTEPGARPPLVLLVEDDQDTRALLALLLELHGYKVVAAENGLIGLDQARVHQPCVILLDLMMPVMDGREFRRTQLTDDAIRRIPVIVLSAKADGRAVAEELTARAYFQKPFDVEQLLPQVGAACSSARA